MTTTAEKIRDLQLGIKRTEEAIGVIKSLQIELTKIKQGIKPADPEPLECWSNLYESIEEIESFLKKGAAELGAGCGQPVRTVVHMREVTPQDEQDRKDAARYRFYRSNRLYKSVDFDKEIDEAMEEE